MTRHTDTSALPSCCRPAPEKKHQGFLMGLLYGLVPHTFCILFIVLSVIGATAATSLVKRVLYVPYFFQLLVVLSVAFATLSAILYLRRNGLLSWRGAGRKWRYLTIMYTTTIAINLLFFRVIFPAVANLDLGDKSLAAPVLAQEVTAASDSPSLGVTKSVTLEVDIPCSGHAPLIIDELKKVQGISEITYRQPNLFEVSYLPDQVDLEKILAQEVFVSFKAKVRS
jgi:hypothetical protein